MNKRRKVGSTLFLSTLAALSIVGMGLAATTALASGSAEFGIIFEDNTTHTNGSVTVAEGSKDATLKVTMNDGGTSVAFSEAILFEYTPETPLDLVNNDLVLNWDASLPEGFDTYFNVANTSGKLSPDDASSLAEPTTYTFTLPVDALGVTVKEEADLAAAEEALKDSKIGISYEVNLEEKQEAPVVEVTSVSLNKEALTLAPGASETLFATVAPEDASDKSLTWSSSDDKVATVDNHGKVTAAENAADDATATITVASKNGKSASCLVTIDAPEPEPVVTDLSLDKETIELTIGDEAQTLTADVTMSAGEDVDVAWSYDPSDTYADIITVTGNGNSLSIAPKAAGTVTITATAGDFSDSCVVTVSEAAVVDPFADAIEVGVSEFLKASDREGKLYKLTGVVGEVTNTTYGNSTLYDKNTGESLTLYGLSGNRDALSVSGGTWSFNNPRDYSTAVAGKFEAGDEIVMYGVYEDFNGTPEIKGVFDSIATEKVELSYDVKVASDIQNGTVAVSKDSGIFGEEITITATPSADYRLDSVTVNGRTINPENEAYKFAVLPGENIVSASFVEASAPVTKFEITTDKLGLGEYADGKVDLNTGAGIVSFSWEELGDYGNGIQWRNKNNKSSLWNTTELPFAIESIQFNFNQTCSGTLNVAFADSALASDQSTGTEVTYNADGVVVNNDVEGAKYFRIDHSSGGSMYIDSIVINFVVA